MNITIIFFLILTIIPVIIFTKRIQISISNSKDIDIKNSKLYGHGVKSISEGLKVNTWTSGIIFIGLLFVCILSIYLKKEIKLDFIWQLIISLFFLLQLWCSTYLFSEIKHLKDNVMNKPKFFLKLGKLGLIYILWSTILLSQVVELKFVIPTILLSLILFYLSMGDLFQYKGIDNYNEFKGLPECLEICMNMFMFISENNYRIKVITLANNNMKMISNSINEVL